MIEDVDLLLAVLNSTPVVDGRDTDELQGDEGVDLVRRFAGTGTAAELDHLRDVRGVLQQLVEEQPAPQTAAADRLGDLVATATLVPQVDVGGIRWRLQVSPDRALGTRAALAWARVCEQLPGRLRPCANDRCHLFLLDQSRPGNARWCSMATCGNRAKARTHAQRHRRPGSDVR